MTAMRSDSVWLAILCFAELVSMTQFSSFNAMIPDLQKEWQLSNSQVGLILSSYQIGYACAVVIFSTLTDWIGARRVYITGALWASAAGVGFATSDGFASAFVWRSLAGIGLAGTYMPGLRLVTERFQQQKRGSAVGWYTAAFVIGTSISLLLTVWSTALWGWRIAAALMAIGPFIAAGAMLTILDAPTPVANCLAQGRGALKPVFENGPALRLIAAYGAHTWELMGMRGWILPLLTVAASASAADSAQALTQAGGLAALILAIGAVPHPFAGALSDRWGRHRVVSSIMIASALCSLAIGWTLALPFGVAIAVGLLYGLTVTAESPVLSTAIAEAAEPAYLGRTMALQSAIGFAMGATAPAAVGIVLDSASHFGATVVQAWGLAFSTLGLVALLGPLCLSKQTERDNGRG
jgi:MFS family permease